jgi:hypothetical protein
MSFSEYVQVRKRLRKLLSRGIINPGEFQTQKLDYAVQFRRLNNRPTKVVGLFRRFEGFSPY